MPVKENFIYTTGWSAAMAAIGAVVNPQIAIATDAPFRAFYFTVTVRQGALGTEVIVTNFAGDLQLSISQVGKTLSNAAIPIDAIAGTGREPYVFAPPRVFGANTTLIFTITSNVATRTEVNVCLHGEKLYAGEPRV
jgi:hypothetical protein